MTGDGELRVVTENRSGDETALDLHDGLFDLDGTWFVHERDATYDGERAPRDFRDLRVFTEARSFVKSVYSLTAEFPREERFGITDQLRRASISIVANIAEGNGRQHRREYVQFLSVAIGSARECQALLIVAEDLAFAHDLSELHGRLDCLVAMLHRLREAIRTPKS